jgi:hypothetical protein
MRAFCTQQFDLTSVILAAVEKETEAGQDERFAYCITAMQGWRICMSTSLAVLSATWRLHGVTEL